MVRFSATPPEKRQIERVRWDLLGDGLDGWTIAGEGMELVTEVSFTPLRAGTFELQGEVTDGEGCKAFTGIKRVVEVKAR